MSRGDDRQLVEIAASLVPLATDGCTIDLIDDHALVCVAASHLVPATEAALFHLGKRGTYTRASSCAIKSGGATVGEVVAWGVGPLAPIAEALLCSAAAHVGALLDARAEAHRAKVAEAERSAIIAMVGHEVRAPLQTLTVGLELIQMRIASTADELPREWLIDRCNALGRAIARLTDVARRLLDVSRHETGAVQLETADDDLGVIVDDVIARIRKDADWAGSPIHLIDEGGITGHWDRLHLETVIENLLTNAIKYGAGSPIRITLRGASADSAMIEVKDSGAGIRASDVPRVFDRFFRGVTPVRQAGLGVGLWIVKRLVEAHDGTISCESAVGEGTTFRVELPRTLKGRKWARGRSESPPEVPGR